MPKSPYRAPQSRWGNPQPPHGAKAGLILPTSCNDTRNRRTSPCFQLELQETGVLTLAAVALATSIKIGERVPWYLLPWSQISSKPTGKTLLLAPRDQLLPRVRIIPPWTSSWDALYLLSQLTSSSPSTPWHGTERDQDALTPGWWLV